MVTRKAVGTSIIRQGSRADKERTEKQIAKSQKEENGQRGHRMVSAPTGEKKEKRVIEYVEPVEEIRSSKDRVMWIWQRDQPNHQSGTSNGQR